MIEESTSGEIIKSRYLALVNSGLSKHLLVRRAIVSAIEAQALRFRDKLPPEKQLADSLGISLGTTQKALGSLAAEGYLLREHGNGTFVGNSQGKLSGIWHFRFRDPDTGQHLPVFTKVQFSAAVSDGPWTSILGADPAGYSQIDRSVDVDGRFLCYSEFYVSATTFPGMLQFANLDLENVNLKTILQSNFGLATVESTGRASVVAFDADIAAKLQVAPASYGMRLDVIASTEGKRPISFQRIWIPQTPYTLDVDFANVI